jgi:hypothetical protein
VAEGRGAIDPRELHRDQDDLGFHFGNNGEPLYRVGDGDTLTSIAQQHLGKASRSYELYQLNQERLADPDRLRVGTILKLPVDASRIGVVPKGPPASPWLVRLMLGRFLAALLLVMLVALAGTALEKHNREQLRQISLQTYRWQVLQREYARARLMAETEGAPARMLERLGQAPAQLPGTAPRAAIA